MTSADAEAATSQTTAPALGLPVEARDSRLASVEMLRVVACFGIVWFHHAGSNPINFGNPGVALFLIISIAFLVKSLRKSDISILKGRCLRLLKVWLAWSAVFVFFVLAKSLVVHRPLTEAFSLWMLLAGPSIHLWFVSFLIIATLGVGLMWPLLIRAPNPGGIIAVLACASIPTCAWLFEKTSAYPMPQWTLGTPAVLFGTLLGLQLHGMAWPVADRLAWLASMVLGAAIAHLCHLDGDVSYAMLFAGLAISIGWGLSVPWQSGVRWLASLTLGIYLVHVIFGSLLAYMCPQLASLEHVSIVFAVSAVASGVLKGTPFRSLV